MRKNLLLLFCACVLIVTAVSAQVVMTQTNLIGAGSTVYKAVANTAGVTPGVAGNGVTWDYSTLVPVSYDSVVINNAATTPYHSNFPTANLMIVDNGDIYVNNSPSMLRVVGVVMPISGTDSAKVTDTEKILVYPMGYQSQFQDTSGIAIKIRKDTTVTIPGIPFPVTLDSARYFQNITKTVVANGDGMLITPDGTFSCLKIKTHKKETSGYDVHIVLSNTWQNISSSTDTSVYEYAWWSAVLGYTALEVDLDSGAVNSVKYRVQSIPTTVEKLNNKAFDISVSPNPASEEITITASEKLEYVKIFDLIGKEVRQVNMNSNRTQVDCHSLLPGVYMLKAKSGDKTITKKIVIQ